MSEDGLFQFMASMEDDNAPDGAWWAMLEDAVGFFNTANGTKHDPLESVHGYIESEERERYFLKHVPLK